MPIGTKVATAYIETVVDSEKAKGQAVSDARAIAKGMTQAFVDVFKTGVVVNELNKAIGAASRLEQAVGGSAAIFGDAAVTIDRFAKTSASSIGIAESAVRELTSQIGGLLNGLGFTQQESANLSIELTKLGADLAAAFGGKPEEAVRALGGALRGEFDPLERFGVSLRASTVSAKALELGLASSKSEIDDNARATATLALIQERTANVQGQFGRELETAAGQSSVLTAKIEDMRAKIGEQLLPVYVKITTLVSNLVDAFIGLPTPIQNVVVALAAIATVSGPINNAIKAFGGLSSIITNLGPQALAASAAIGVAVIAYQHFTKQSREVSARTEDVSEALSEAVKNLLETGIAGETAALGIEALNEALINSGEDGQKLKEALGAIGKGSEDAVEVLARVTSDSKTFFEEVLRGAGATAEETKRLTDALAEFDSMDSIEDEFFGFLQYDIPDELKGVVAALEELDDQAEKTDVSKIAADFLNSEAATDEFRRGLVELAEALTGATRSGAQADEVYGSYLNLLSTFQPVVDGVAAAITQLKEETTDGAEETEVLRVNTRKLAEEFNQAEAEANALKEAFDTLFGINVSLQGAQDAVIAGTAKLTETFKENGLTLDQNTEKGRANRAAIREQTDTIFNYAEALLQSGEANDTVAGKVQFMVAELKNQMLQAGYTEEEVDAYLETLGLTPENVTTSIQIAGDQVAKEKVQAFLDNVEEIPDEVASEIQALIDEGEYEEAQRRLDELTRPRDVRIRTVNAGGYQVYQSAAGRFVRGGTNMITSVAERMGSAGDEVILPLGNSGRLQTLLADPRVGPRVAEAMGGAGGTSVSVSPSVRVYIGTREITDIISTQVDEYGDEMAGAFAVGRRPG
jgi:regulator of replication initiation timing